MLRAQKKIQESSIDRKQTLSYSNKQDVDLFKKGKV